MENKIESSIISSFLLLFSLLATTSAKSPLFIFGDSVLDAGNNNYINTSTSVQANFWPYGITSFRYPTGRMSDGRLICDFIAGALVLTNQGLVIDLHMQLENFKKVKELWIDKLGEVKAKKKLTSAVYLFNIGANDYFSLFVFNSTFLTSYTKPEYVNMVIGNITSVITDIYKTGGRKFAFLNIPKIGCAPFFRMSTANGECEAEPTNYAMIHNRALSQVLIKLKVQLPGFKYSLYDWDSSSQQRVDYPSKYGFKEGKTACCGTGKFRGVFSCGGTRVVKEYELCENVNDYVFWDSTHLTEKAYRQIADEMWNISPYGSHSIKELFHLP
ncbi:GDSL esterase/lipase 5 [Bienertia sinuspersici]